MRTPILAGNWKLNKNVKEAVDFVESLYAEIGRVHDREVLVCPVFTSLYAVGKHIGDKCIKMGAQNLYCEEKGAYTGEVAPLMLKDVGCTYVIIGHSERRKYFGECDDFVNRKVKAALNAGLLPIICVGESLEEKEAGQTQAVTERQVRGAVKDLSATDITKIVIAYEPIWAIGSGKSDSPEGAQETISSIRRVLADIAGEENSQKIRILYGGSVKPENIDAFMRQKDIDGALVGGASLKVESFARIVNFQ